MLISVPIRSFTCSITATGTGAPPLVTPKTCSGLIVCSTHLFVVSQNRARQTGCASLSFERQLVSSVGHHFATSFFQALLGDRITFQHDALTRSECQHIRSHSYKFCIGNLNQAEIASLQLLPE